MIRYNQKREREVVNMNKVLVFDMDGTIANLYGVNGWLTDLRAENTRPYAIAKPMWDMIELANILSELKNDGWKVVVTTWLAKGGSKKYNKATAKVKKAWLNRFDFPYDKFNAVEYGTEKYDCTSELGGFQILFDDCEEIRNSWKGGEAVNPETVDIIEYLALKLK